MSDLDARLRRAHQAQDVAKLAALYEEAADVAKEEDAIAFFLTHAYVHALEANAPSVEHLRQRLILMGRDVPQG